MDCVAYKMVKTYLELHTTTAPEFYVCSCVHCKSRLNKSNKMQHCAESRLKKLAHQIL